jgi:hypothetical protein
MNVVGLAVISISSKTSKSIIVKYRPPVLGDEDQMHMHLENAMPAVTDFA